MDAGHSVERDEATTVPYVRAARGCTAAAVLAFAALVVWLQPDGAGALP
ncbi:hypothetical protein [Actinacidiphila glaucinigra]